MPTTILGISAYYHDAAACLVRDGDIIAAAQEERFTRKKHDASFPSYAVAYCLKAGGLRIEDVDHVAFYEKPLMKFDRLLETYLAFAPRGLCSFLAAMPVWLQDKLWLKRRIQQELGCAKPILFGDHHESHAASAFYPSPFEEAAILTMDVVGEWATSSYGYGKGNELTLLKEMRFPHSVGMLYSAFTYFTGFQVNSGEYKMRGLAPYGEPKYASLIKEHLVRVFEDGSVQLNLDYFDYCTGLTMTNQKFAELFGGPPRAPESPMTQREMDLARSIQEVTEEIMLTMARHVYHETGLPYLCLAGGVALNCVGNGRILREGPFRDIWVQLAAGDAGGALGVALAVWHRHLRQPRRSLERAGRWEAAGLAEHAQEHEGGRRFIGESPALAAVLDRGEEPPRYGDRMQGALLGPQFSDEEIAAWLTPHGYPFIRHARETLPKRIAQAIADGQVIGLLQGRMEFGPRALGARLILGDVRSPKMQSLMNVKIKFREFFRPFAPSVLRERVSDWFEFSADSPYMLMVARVIPSKCRAMTKEEQGLWGIEKLNVPRSEIPAVTHVDYSARIQTVRREANPLFYDILSAFYELTGCPVIVNTSFNVRGEPIVCTPADAYRCFMRTAMDLLVLETCVLEKARQPAWHETTDWRSKCKLD